MEVPEMVLVAEFPPIQELVMREPGAKTSTQVPQLEKGERSSSWLPPSSSISVAPTVMAVGTLAGED